QRRDRSLLVVIYICVISATPLSMGFDAHHASAQGKKAAKDTSHEQLPEGAMYRIGSMRWRHPGGIISFAFFPDSKRLASLGGDATVRVWEAESGMERLSFRVPAKPKALAIVDGGKAIVSAHDGGKLYVWEAATGNQIKVIDYQNRGVSLLVSAPNGKLLA